MTNSTLTYLVIEKRKSGDPLGHGTHKFQAPARVGEYLSLPDKEGTQQAFRIIRVIHAVDSNGGAADLWIEAAGTLHELHNELLRAE